jgi:hypothetical protein
MVPSPLIALLPSDELTSAIQVQRITVDTTLTMDTIGVVLDVCYG